MAGAAQLSGYGLVPLAAVRDLAQQATWRAVAVDDRTGEVVARSSRAYRPSPSLAALVIDRDVTCTFPGCRVPAVRCDLDHITAFDQDRPAVAQTTEDNLQALCRHHHRLKTHESWTPERDPATGVTTWISPTGHRYTRDPVPADPDYIDPPRRPPRRTVPADPPRPARGLDEPECEEASQHPSACAADASCGPDSACASGSACAPGSTGASDTAPTLEAGRDSSPGLGVDDDREAEANAGQAVDRDPDPAAGPSKPGDGERDGRDSGIKPDGEGAGAR